MLGDLSCGGIFLTSYLNDVLQVDERWSYHTPIHLEPTPALLEASGNAGARE